MGGRDPLDPRDACLVQLHDDRTLQPTCWMLDGKWLKISDTKDGMFLPSLYTKREALAIVHDMRAPAGRVSIVNAHEALESIFATQPKSSEATGAKEALTVTGIKTDEGKLRWHLMPFDALEEVINVMHRNAQPNGKYPERNWERGISYSRLFSAALRHIIKWFRGEENDQESGLPHLAHASCCIIFLLAYTLRAKKEGSNLAQFDDRPKGI